MTDPRRGIVVFDNSGTLSEVVVEAVALVEDGVVDAPVPEVDPDHPCALVSLGGEDYTVFDTTEPFGSVIERDRRALHVALSNVEPTDAAVRAAVEAERSVPARVVTEQLRAVAERVDTNYPEWAAPPLGVQVVVDLHRESLEQVLGYTTVPLAEGAAVVEAVRAAGFEPHIVSGDATHILRAVATAVDIPPTNVHPYQSPTDKAATVRALQARGPGPVVMVGDYLNDTLAFEAADYAVYVEDPDRSFPALAARADAVIEELGATTETLEDLVPTT